MTEKKKALYLVGSPRGKKSSSTAICTYLSDQMNQSGIEPLDILWLENILRSQDKIEMLLAAINEADFIILAAPLYDDCQPYIVIKVMELISLHLKKPSKQPSKEKYFSVIVNCAFPEEHHNETVISIYKQFSRELGFQWGGSVSITSGEALDGRKGKSLEETGGRSKKVRLALTAMASSLAENRPVADQLVRIIPRILTNGILVFVGKIFLWLNNRNWAAAARKRGQDVNARPYVE